MSFDWNAIRSEFNDLRNILEDIPDPPSERQVDVHMVMRKLEQTSILGTQLDWGYYFCGTEPTRKRLRELNADIDCGGAPPDRPTSFPPVRNCFTVIEEALESQTCSAEFVEAWGYLNRLFGRYVELMATSGLEEKEFKRSIRSGLPKTTAPQRYWHAHWVTANSKPDFSDRGDAEDKLIKLCEDIRQERLKPPLEFTSDWFEAMIRPDGDDVVLRSAYARAKNSDLKEMARDVPVAILPPLSRRSFVKP